MADTGRSSDGCIGGLRSVVRIHVTVPDNGPCFLGFDLHYLQFIVRWVVVAFRWYYMVYLMYLSSWVLWDMVCWSGVMLCGLDDTRAVLHSLVILVTLGSTWGSMFPSCWDIGRSSSVVYMFELRLLSA